MQDLAETYLPAFHRVVDAGAGGIMCSYNAINGVPSCVNSEMLNGKLRGDFGFQGIWYPLGHSFWGGTPLVVLWEKGGFQREFHTQHLKCRLILPTAALKHDSNQGIIATDCGALRDADTKHNYSTAVCPSCNTTELRGEKIAQLALEVSQAHILTSP